MYTYLYITWMSLIYIYVYISIYLSDYSYILTYTSTIITLGFPISPTASPWKDTDAVDLNPLQGVTFCEAMRKSFFS